ncbi:peptidoglycan-binding protein [Ramlibacter sp. RBP-2]|uniref:Peptidoglycan-binding protein n=1 Tax=Ramlibacter lithotrophicus TaxID=2606681 RepID=A0A7X6DHL0_9BURK|nr:peptidoglycan-binding protein [Ramlibacter lithotrophicus]NKE67294.1 peptidoglycan-binding protein [Ramlibacter lithotrophicus]
MSQKSVHLIALATLAAALQACVATAPKLGDGSAKTAATGSAGGANAQNASSQLEKCSQPLGTMALVEDQQAAWYQQLTSQYRLPSTVPVLRLLVQQSNCFVVVDRGRALANMQQERAFQQTGELRANSNFGKGQMVSADYSINPEVLFSEQGTGGIGGAVAMFNPIVGALVAGIRTNEAAAILTLVDNRSGVQVAAAEGSAKNADFGLGGLVAGGAGAVGLGGYTNTPQGKVVAAAFLNAYNQLVQAVRNYTPQSMGGEGLGAGGKLAVDGAAAAPAPRSGLTVKEAQERLRSLGYDTGTPDGLLGRKTAAAVRAFQADRKLPATGMLDEPTRAELQR